MADENKQRFGDGQDNWGQAIKSGADAVRLASANTAAASVKAGMDTGKVISKLAAGTATGGPYGAVLSAMWAMRHTIFKTIVCLWLVFLFFVVALTSLPSVVFNEQNAGGLQTAYNMLSVEISNIIATGYAAATAEVERIISDGGYDYDYSMDSLIDNGYESAGFDIYYILAAYSASMEQNGTTSDDMLEKLNAVAGNMFPVTYIEKQIQVEVETDDEPEIVTISYVECTIHPFDMSVILEAFQIDPDAVYGEFGITYAQAIDYMANALRMTMYGTASGGSIPPLTDEELTAFLNSLDCSPSRKELIKTGLSLVGRVPYFWGGKSDPGWNDEWNTPKLVTAAGSSTTGTLQPYGLDCSGFTDWVYETALGFSLPAGSANQWNRSYAIPKAELLPGDLGFLAEPGTISVNHVLIFAGKGNDGKLLWVHCEGGSGVVLSSPSYVSYYRRVKDIELG